MNNLKDEYELLINRYIEIQKELKALEKNKLIKRYLNLSAEKESFIPKINDLHKKMKISEFSTCNHILVLSRVDHDYIEGRAYRYHGCIKCGLDESVLSDSFRSYSLTYDQEIMYDFLQTYGFHNSIDTGICCDLTLAKSLYSKLKQDHPDIDDEKAVKYFKIEIEDYKINNKVKKKNYQKY